MTTADLRALRFCGALRAKGHVVEETLLRAEWKAVDRAKRAAEARLAEAVEPVLASAALRAAGRIADGASAADGASTSAEPSSKRKPEGLTAEAVAAFNVELLAAELADVFGVGVLEVLRAGFASGAVRTGSLNLTFNADRASVRRAAETLIEQAQSVPETLRSMVDTIVRDGLAAGLDGAEIGEAIRKAVPEMTANQARLVGRTTGTGAFEAGQVEAYGEAGMDAKRWLSQRDGNVRPEHDALDGEEVGLDEAFSNGEHYPSAPNCRCSTLPVARAAAQKRAVKAAPSGGRPWRTERDAAIRAAYPALRDAHGREVAVDRLADRYSVSADTIKRALGQK